MDTSARSRKRVAMESGKAVIEVVETSGRGRQDEPVRVGVPFPRGAWAGGGGMVVRGPEGTAPSQTRVLSRWPDGSAKWVLVDFLARVPGRSVTRYALVPETEIGPSRPGLSVVWSGKGRWTAYTGGITFRAGPEGAFLTAGTGKPDDDEPAYTVRLLLTLADGRAVPVSLGALEPEAQGTVRVDLTGATDLSVGRGKTLRVRTRLSFWAGIRLCRIEVEVHNPGAAAHPGGLWDLGDPGSVFFRDLSLWIGSRAPCSGAVLVPEPGQPALRTGAERLLLYQDSSGGATWDSPAHVDHRGEPTVSFRGYRIYQGEKRIGQGERATPWMAVQGPRGWVGAAVAGFWQNFPKALEGSGEGLRIGLFPGECRSSHELQGGEKKRHVVWLEFGAGEPAPVHLPGLLHPPVVRIPVEWVERCGVVKRFVPASKDPNREYLDYVRHAVEGENSFFSKREAADEYGWRNYGDLYADHEAVNHRGDEPFVSHYNNQYDFVYAAFVHFLRTGDHRWFTLFDDLARHVADIDIYHTDEDKPAYNHGLFWHTDHYRPAGRCTHRTFTADGLTRAERRRTGGGPCNEHNYTSGLLHHYWFTGDPGSRDAVLELAGWVLAMDDGTRTVFGWIDPGPTGLASQTVSPDYHKPGRGAANSVNALLDAYALTGERAYMDKAEELIRRCIHPADDIESLGLADQPEYRWSYLVLLQVLGKYLDTKIELGELDYMYAYARESLLHYARWMLEHEVPYKDVLHKVEIPTETWPAQDIRKCWVLNVAGEHAPDGERPAYLARARFFFDRCLEDLLSFPTAYLTRPMVLLVAYGWIQAFFDRNGAPRAPEPTARHRFGVPESFQPQRARLRQAFRDKWKATVGAFRLRLRQTVAAWKTGRG